MASATLVAGRAPSSASALSAATATWKRSTSKKRRSFSRAAELYAGRLLRVHPAAAEEIHPARDALGRALGHGRMRVVLVEHRHVIVDVLLLLVHAAQAVLHDDRHLVAERGVEGDAVGH